MAMLAARGCTHNVSARNRIDNPKQVIAALR
jgi:hypothetical protein